MAVSRIFVPTDEQEAEWKTWVRSRPPSVRAIAERFDPWTLYRMKSTGQRVTVVAINENGTVRVDVSGQFNAVLFERTVFGIDPADLESCEPPGPDEAVGSVLDQDQVEENLDTLRVIIRPDIWEAGADGRSRRRAV